MRTHIWLYELKMDFFFKLCDYVYPSNKLFAPTNLTKPETFEA